MTSRVRLVVFGGSSISDSRLLKREVPPLVVCMVHAPPLVTAFPEAGFPCWFSVVGLFCVSFDSLICACINLVIGFRPECVIDSLFK
jgi:hypothetical protein